MHPIVFLIPAYQPTEELIDLVKELRSLTADPIIVVNDGSEEHCRLVFQEISQISEVHVLEHAINLGKGAALKTGFNYALVKFVDLVGVVTVDADGQHRPEDAVRVGETLLGETSKLIMGCRSFPVDHEVPFRSRFGNVLTQKVFWALTGVALSDTQTGLRAIPRELMKSMLLVQNRGYDFETDMLMIAVRNGIAIREVKIPTIYINHNAGSHFNPIVDSIKIYFVFIRFLFASIATAFIDFIAFAVIFGASANILIASISGRLFSGTFNFIVSKRLVFHSRGRVFPQIVRYAVLVSLFLFLSNSAVSALVRRLDCNIYLAKILVETSLFLLSFTAQRLIIFPVSNMGQSLSSETDWDSYYSKPFVATSITRRITTRTILNCLRKYGADLKHPVILELGGANSCFYGAVSEALKPTKYLIIDKNLLGLKKFHETYSQTGMVELLHDDVLALKESPKSKADICFSVGLIEHFPIAGTRKAVQTHFECTNPGGLVLMTFPTPTWLYNITRGLAEALNMWKFPDERPCSLDEISESVTKFADIKYQGIIWPIFLTQGIILARTHKTSLRNNG